MYLYFRAPSPEVAAVAFDGADEPADLVEAVEPSVALGRLIARVRGVEWSPGLVDHRMLTDDPDHDAWVMELDLATRDTLAGIPADAQRFLARWWAGIEEFAVGDPGDLLPVLRDLVALAGRARAHGEPLYLWTCL